jgi:hypothetical protein
MHRPSHNTGLYMLRRRWRRVTVLLGHSATLHSHVKPPLHFGPVLTTQALIWTGKMSYTAGRLCEMLLPCIYWQIFTKNIGSV